MCPYVNAYGRVTVLVGVCVCVYVTCVMVTSIPH